MKSCRRLSNSNRRFERIAKKWKKADPDLVYHDEQGRPESVRYDAVNAMLLNEFLKEHKKVEEQQASIAELKSTVALQQKGMEVLTAQLKEQAEQIQRVSAQVEVNKSAPQTRSFDREQYRAVTPHRRGGFCLRPRRNHDTATMARSRQPHSKCSAFRHQSRKARAPSTASIANSRVAEAPG